MKRIVMIGGLAALTLAGCKKAAQAPVYIAVPVERRNIVAALARTVMNETNCPQCRALARKLMDAR